MNKYMIRGGRELFGEVTVSGAKNAAVAIIPAALLVDGVCRIENIPQISDVTLFFSILEELGAKVRVLNQHAIEIDCHAIHSTRPSYDLARRIRASYYLLGALLGRFGQATVAMPGGCNIGARKIDMHILGLEALGVAFEIDHGNIHIGKAGSKRHMGWRPTVRGSVMNPCDHPHGGGEGKAPIGRPGPVTPWGKPALGYKTRKNNKSSDKLIVRRRNGK